jgi:hypothetical protein
MCSCTTTISTLKRHCTGTISDAAFEYQGSYLGELLKECAIRTHSSNASRMQQVNLTSLLTESTQWVYACLLMDLLVILLMSITEEILTEMTKFLRFVSLFSSNTQSSTFLKAAIEQ